MDTYGDRPADRRAEHPAGGGDRGRAWRPSSAALIGIGRLSKNWLLARLTATYVETLRDLPLLLQLLFCVHRCSQGLPGAEAGLARWQPSPILCNRGMRLPGTPTGSPPTRLGARRPASSACDRCTMLWNRRADPPAGGRPAIRPDSLAGRAWRC